MAADIIAELLLDRASLPPVLKLGLLMSRGDKATESFVKIKERVADTLQVVVVREMIDESTSTEDAARALGRLVENCDGVVVQLPLPKQIDTEEILKHIPPSKDVDALGGDPSVLAPVAGAVKEILERTRTDVVGKKVVVVGEGRLVGKPVAQMLEDMGAEVMIVSLEKNSLEDLKNTDIVISGAGSPGLIKPEMLKEGVVLIDAGTSENGGKVVGDCDLSCAETASVFVPVPGGVGPVAVAMLFKNLFILAKK